jgi:hypothetical protein
MSARRLLPVIAAIALLAASAPETATAMTWSVGEPVDHLAPLSGYEQPLTSLACGSASLCVASDQYADLMTSTDPAGGGWTEWPFAGSPPDANGAHGYVDGLACPSATLCVAAGEAANPGFNANTVPAKAWTSTGPASGAWSATTLETRPGSSDSAGAVTCASTSFCLTVTLTGSLFASTNPAADTWQAAGAISSTAAPISTLSCPAATLCLAADNENFDSYLETTTAPLSGNWTVSPIGANWVNGIACPTMSLCLAVDRNGGIEQTTTPASGGWTRSEIDPSQSLNAIDCPSSELCVAVDGAGAVFTNTDPGSGSWQRTDNDPGQALDSISCPSASLCVAGDDRGIAATSTDPSDPSHPWTLAQASGITPLTAVSCSPAGLCAVVDGTGHEYATADPRGGLSAWKGAEIDPGRRLSAVSCTGSSRCVAVDGSGGVLSSTDATAGTPWTRKEIDAGTALLAVSCPGARLCVATDGGGGVLSSAHPAGRWRTVRVGDGTLSGISCPTTHLCAAIEGRDVVVSGDPSGGRRQWRTVAVSAHDHLLAISCSGARRCTAVGVKGQTAEVDVLTTDHPLSPRAWTRRKLAEPYPFFRYRAFIACPSIGPCFVGDTDSAVRSGRPTAPGRWAVQHVDRSPYSGITQQLTGLSCASAGLCVAIDALGQVLVGSG